MKIYLNGEIVDKGQVGELFEPGFLFGWGAFETLRSYAVKTAASGRPAFLKEHLERLNESLDFLGLDRPQIDFGAEFSRLMGENDLRDAYLRVTVYKKKNSLGVILDASEFNYYRDDVYEKGVKLVPAPFSRFSRDQFLKIKSVSYVKNRLAWAAAQKQGAEEAIFFNEKGFIQEGSRSNIFFIKGRRIFTPAADCGLLEGVTRKAVLDICRQQSLSVAEDEYTLEDLFSAEEVFITSSLMEVMPVREIDGKQFKVKNYTLTPAIRALYKKSAQGEV